MEKQNLRVIVASEYPQARDFLKEVVEKEGTFLVGQAQDVTRAVTLAKNLRPDVAIIDCNLPYSVGLDTVRLSRMGGLDTAQIISETIPSTRVIIITNLDAQVLREHRLSMDAMAFFSRERIGGNITLKLEELCQELMLPKVLVFANVEVEPWPAPSQKGDRIAGGAMFFGTAGILGGGFLIGTLILAPVGVVLALAGVVTVFFGLIRKLTARLWRKER